MPKSKEIVPFYDFDHCGHDLIIQSVRGKQYRSRGTDSGIFIQFKVNDKSKRLILITVYLKLLVVR